jgi:predicted dehydrogenase
MSNNDGPLRVGIIGLSADRGWAANAHVPALAHLPEYALVALATTRQESADAAARRYGVPHAFGDSRALIESPEVDVVSISVKVPDHHVLVMRALAAGKHVFCEWPLGANTDEANEMAQAAAVAGVQNVIGLQAQTHPVVARARELIAGGYVGRIMSASLNGATDAVGGAVVREIVAWGVDNDNGMNLLTVPASHAIDPFLHCIGELRDISARLVTGQPCPTVAETGEELHATAPDLVVAHGSLEQGGVASIHFQGGAAGRNGAEIRIYGSDGMLVIRADGLAIQRGELTLDGGRGDSVLARVDASDHYSGIGGSGENVARLYARLAEAIRGGEPTAPDFGHAVRRHRLLDDIRSASAASGAERAPQ